MLHLNSYPCHTKYVFVDTAEVYNSKYGQIKLVSLDGGCPEVDLSLDPHIRSIKKRYNRYTCVVIQVSNLKLKIELTFCVR